MATYNGMHYVKAQLSTILEQLGPSDEVVVVDDCSSDATLEAVRSFADPRIKIFENERNAGHVASFSRALSLARHDTLIMADQDDIWLPARVERMAQALAKPGNLVLSSNSEFMDSSGAPIEYDCEGVTSASSTDFAGNIRSIFTGRRRYYGCAMAVRREFCKVLLPIPAYVESHDLWIAMAGNMARANVHIDESTLLRRVHGNNASIVSRPLAKKLWSRVIFAVSFMDLWLRIRRA
jgi:glycosyltransferase involved in cell wall biosynthesis